MSVAPSYQKYPIIGDPYEQDKKQYVKIKYPCCRKASCQKCGGQGYYPKEVRWHDDPIVFDARNGFGFCDAGYITLIDGPEDVLDDYFRGEASGQARYNVLFHWFLPSFYALPQLPRDCHFKQLKWEQVSENGKARDYEDIKQIVHTFLTGEEPVDSEYVGNVGDKIELDLVVIADTINKGYYGDTHTFIFEDELSNRYAWKTSARKLEVGEIYRLKGTIKEHNKIEGIKHTVLTRCKEV